jgi:hypothetical protein
MTTLYVKIGAAVALLAATFFAGWHLGGLASKDKLDAAKAQSATQTVTALEKNAAAEANQAAIDTQAEAAHEKTLADLDAIVPDPHPIFVYSAPPACNPSPVPRAPAQAAANTADPGGGGAAQATRRDIRPALDELEKRLEIYMADYRRLNAEWPQTQEPAKP